VRKIKLDLFPQKGKFQRIGNAFRHFYPFFYLFAKESKGISGIKLVGSADNACPEALVRRLLHLEKEERKSFIS